MVFVIRSMPAMSAEVERLFRSAKILTSDSRNRLGVDIIAAVECMKSWEKAGLVEVKKVRQVESLLHASERPLRPSMRPIRKHVAIY